MKHAGMAVLFLVSLPPLSAQDAPAKPVPGKAKLLLTRAIQRKTRMETYAFEGRILFPETQGGANPFPAPVFLRSLRPVGKEVKGRAWSEGLVDFTLDGEARAVMKGGFILYREGENTWRLRLGTGRKGEPLWWLPDPNRLLKEILASRPEAKIVRNETLDQHPVRVVQVVLEKKAAQDLFLSHLLPDPTKAPLPGGKQQVVFLVGSAVGPKTPKDLRYELLFWIEPGRAAIRRLQVKATASPKGFMGGRVRFQIRGGKPVPRRGKKKKEVCRVNLVIDFQEDAKIPPPDLPPSVSRRLGLSFSPPAQEKGKEN